VPRGAAPRAKDKTGGAPDEVAAETQPSDSEQKGNRGKDGGTDEPPADVEQSLTAPGGERTLLEMDADGDYIPDALDN
jgi:hypothetical protein